MITTRSQFVARRNEFFDLLAAEKIRLDAVPSRYADQRASGGARMVKLQAAYADLCAISAIAAPIQADFDRAEDICIQWGA